MHKVKKVNGKKHILIQYNRKVRHCVIQSRKVCQGVTTGGYLIWQLKGTVAIKQRWI